MTDKFAIRLKNIKKSFGTRIALNNVSLDVGDGKVVALIGPSGSGKSTLCRCINRLEKIDSGDIYVKGELVPEGGRKLAEFRSNNIGMLFQSFNLFSNRTIIDNVTLAPIKILGIERNDAEEQAYALLERVGILDEAQKHPSALSGGQQQRAAIARALAMKPKVMLFDEPTSALDPESIKEVLDVMKELAHTGMTMLVVTHEINFARHVADSVIFMDNGEVINHSLSTDFFDNPGNARIREFLHKVSYEA